MTRCKLQITIQTLSTGSREARRGFITVFVPSSKANCDLTVDSSLQDINIRNTYRQIRVIPGLGAKQNY